MKVLFLGAHCDDIELSCGGTIHKHKKDWDIFCLVFCPISIEGENLLEFQNKSFDLLGVKDFKTSNYRPSFLYEDRQNVWNEINEVKSLGFDKIFTHMPDEHQDHVVVYEETVRNFQKETIIQYPTIRSLPSHDVNYYEILSKDNIDVKIKSLQCYGIYKDKFYFDDNLILSQATYCGGYIQAKFAESFKIKQFIEAI